MRMSDVFPSKYLKADIDVPDFEQGGVTYTISHAESGDVGTADNPDYKPVLYFEETEKGLVLNKTNASTLTTMFGTDDTDDWIGKQIKLYSKDVEYQGKMVRGIRVNSRPVAAPPPAPARPARPAAKQVAPVPPVEPGDDDIPF